MSEPRRQLLVALFASLEANGVRYCVQRNYEALYTDTASDVDLLVSPYSRARCERCLRETASDSGGWRLVHATRYVDWSHVFWHPEGGFLRIDLATDVRWRLCTVLTAREVLDARQRRAEFFVPAPEHEAVILWVAAIWRGELSPRYRARLEVLYAACADKEGLRRILVAALGAGGADLARSIPERIAWRQVRSDVFRNSLFQGGGWGRFLGNASSDLVRLGQRISRPAGLSLVYVSNRARDFDGLMARLEFLFPRQKNVVSVITSQKQDPWSWGLRLKRWRTLFRGGFFVRVCRVAEDDRIAKIAQAQAQRSHASVSFIGTEDSTGRICFAHVDSGLMTTSRSGAPLSEPEFSECFIHFLAGVLERHAMRPRNPTRGLFCVLVGLDGSGKTTLARNICESLTTEPRLTGARYFHWRPKVFRAREFPLPEFGNRSRKAPQSANAVNTLLSVLRLAKNAVLINLAWWFKVAPLLRRGRLVLVDRYFYNYYLDPVSVKFTGSATLLAQAQKFFPRPDLVLTLHAPPEVLLQRKQELSEAEIRRQTALLETLPFAAKRVARVDANRPAPEVAAQALKEIQIALKD